MAFGDCLLLSSQCPRSCLHKSAWESYQLRRPESSHRPHPHHPPTPVGGGRGRGCRTKDYALAVEYNMHATWGGGNDLRNVYTDPLSEGPPPGQEALSKGGVHPPRWPGRGALRQSLRVAYPQGEGTAAIPASVFPTQTGGGAEQGEDRVPEAKKVSAPPHPRPQGLKNSLHKISSDLGHGQRHKV